MSFRHLVRVGRHWLNPWFIVEIEDCGRPMPDPGPEHDRVNLTVLPGRSIALVGEEAREIRRLLGDDAGDAAGYGAAPGGPAPPPGEGDEDADDEPPQVSSGRGPIPLIRSPAEARVVAK